MKLLIFDCDGVLVDTEGIAVNSVTETLRAQGYDDEQAAQCWTPGHSLRKALDRLTQSHAPDQSGPGTWQEKSARLEILIRQAMQDKFAAKDVSMLGMPALFRDHFAISCIASNGPLEKMRCTLKPDVFGPLDWTRVFSGVSLQRFKPEPDLFWHAAETLGVAPSNALVIEDSLPGLRAAAAAGIPAIAFGPEGPQILRTHPELKPHVTALCNDAAELRNVIRQLT